MSGSLRTRDYEAFLKALRKARTDAGLTQMDLAKSLGVEQSYVSKSERGERRLDLLELFRWLEAMGLGPEEFVARQFRAWRR